MYLKILLVALGAAALGCAHEPCNTWMPFGGCPSKGGLPQDASVRCPNFYAAIPTRLGADGGIFEFDDLLVQALQVATQDFFDDLTVCATGRPVTKYRVIRQGDIVFVKIEGAPEKCGASYAIDATGKILHRHLGSGILPADDDKDGSDGGQPASPPVLGAVDLNVPATLPSEFFGRDAGTSPGAGTSPDAGTLR